MTFKDLNLIPTLSPLGVQAIVDFGKYELSIIQNKKSYGHEKDLYEIAVFDGNDQVELPGITEAGDTIKGYLTVFDIDAILKKMYTITGNEGKQV